MLDGKLVINHNFRTNDEFIYAAGPFTKYSRRYFVPEQEHQFFDSGEVGEKVFYQLFNVRSSLIKYIEECEFTMPKEIINIVLLTYSFINLAYLSHRPNNKV